MLWEKYAQLGSITGSASAIVLIQTDISDTALPAGLQWM